MGRLAAQAARLVPPPPPLAPTTASVRYILGDDVPYNWIPFIPVHVPGSNRSVQLQRARLPGTGRAPHGRVLSPPAPYYINEEEAPRAGKVITRGYHLYALPANRMRVATDWLNDIVEHRQFVRLGLIQPDRSGLAVAEQTDIYYRTDGRPLDHGRHGAASP